MHMSYTVQNNIIQLTQNNTIQYHTIQYSFYYNFKFTGDGSCLTSYNTIQYNTIEHNTINNTQYNTIHY